MFEPVYKDLAGALKNHIQSLEAEVKLPGVRILGRQFGANPATVSKALHLLQEKGFVSIVQGQGAFVVKKQRELRRKIGIVLLVKPSDSEEAEGKRLKSPYRYTPCSVAQVAGMIAKEAESAGFRAARVNLPIRQALEDPAVLARLPFDGFLFIFSSLNHELADTLKAERIPFVAANACFGIPEVNYLDFNQSQAISDYISLQQERGIRRIGFFDAFGKYGHSEKFRAIFRAKLRGDYRDCYFVNEGFENPLSNYHIDIRDYAGRAVRKMCAGGTPPECVICSGDLAGAFAEAVREAGFRIPLGILTMDARLRGADLLAGSPRELFAASTRRLISMIENNDDSVIQQWIPMTILNPV